MTQQVQLPDGSIAEFPDDMSPDQISGVIKQHLSGAAPAPQKPQLAAVDPGFFGRLGQYADRNVAGTPLPPLSQNAGIGSTVADKIEHGRDYLVNLENLLTHGMTFGTSDEAGALGSTVRGSMQPQNDIKSVVQRSLMGQQTPSFGQRFMANDTAENAAMQNFTKQNPIAANTAEIAGLVTSPLGTLGQNYINGGASLLSRLMRGGATGAAMSGGLTFANANGDVGQRMQNVPFAALTGFPMGVAGTGVGEVLSRIMPSGTANEALRAATNDPSGAAIQQLAQQPGTPAANNVGLADLLKGASAQAPGAADAAVPGALSNLEQSYARTADDINQLISPQNATQLVQDIQSQASRAASSGYGQAYANKTPVQIPAAIAERPSFQDALPIAAKLAKEDGRIFDVNNLTVEDADYIQRALRALGQTSFNSDNAATVAMGPRYGNTRQEVLTQADTVSPEFQATRQSYAEAMSRKDAVQTGLDWMKSTKSADDVASEFAAMSPAEQEAAKAGFATKLKNILAAKPTRQTPTRTLDTTMMVQKLQAIGVNPQDIENILTREQGVKQVYDALTGGSDTARKLAIQKSLANPLADIRGGDVAAAALTNGAAAAGLPVLRATGGAAQRQSANMLVNALSANGPGLLQELIAKDPRFLSGLLGSQIGRAPGAAFGLLNQNTGQ